MVESEFLYAPDTKIAARIVDGQLVILRPGSDELLRFNAVASFVWSQIEVKPKPLLSLVHAVVDEFEVDTKAARTDLMEFLKAMEEQHLIRRIQP